jgi:hypothetical protein
VATSPRRWAQLLLFPQKNETGSMTSADGSAPTSDASLPAGTFQFGSVGNFELSLKYSGVTLTKRCTLDLSAHNQQLNVAILGIYVGELISDARALDG